MSGVELAPIVEYLDRYLRIRELPDAPVALNGLQVENSGRIGGVVAAVDASAATIEGVAELGSKYGAPPLLLVHHGVFWDGNVPMTGRRFRRIATLIRHDIPLYSAHIPLDVHPEVGNNAVLAGALGLGERTPFGDYKGISLGVRGIHPGIERERLVEALDRLLDTKSRLIGGGPPIARRIGVITGAAGDRIGACRDEGIDTFITGEGVHHSYFDAMEFGVNVIYGGHYATEQVGVKALAEHLSQRYGLPWEFHHHPTGL